MSDFPKYVGADGKFTVTIYHAKDAKGVQIVAKCDGREEALRSVDVICSAWIVAGFTAVRTYCGGSLLALTNEGTDQTVCLLVTDPEGRSVNV